MAEKEWYRRTLARWIPYRSVPINRLWVLIAAVFLLFSVFGFYVDLMYRGVLPYVVVLQIALYVGLNASLWIIVLSRLSMPFLVALIVLQFFNTRINASLANWVIRRFDLKPVPSELGIHFAATGTLSVIILSYIFFAVFIRREGRESSRMRNELELAHGIFRRIPQRRLKAMLTAIKESPKPRKSMLLTSAGGLCILMLLVSTGLPAQTRSTNPASPKGWLLAGSNPSNYATGLDPQESYRGFPSAYLKAKPSAMEGFGTLMQEFSAGQYGGKRVRLRASVKAEGVGDWAGLWMRVDKGSTAVSFDNMMDRPIKGTTTWQNYEVILDVPHDATRIAFGILLSKSGSVWLNSVQLESVGLDVPTTGKTPPRLPEGPTNLNFEE